MTTADDGHRYGCDQPGWQAEWSKAVRGVAIARCAGCGLVRLATQPTTATTGARS